jgi:hypothetical protein
VSKSQPRMENWRSTWLSRMARPQTRADPLAIEW